MNKKLVAYFSASGLTASLAHDIAKITSSDIYQIKPITPYTQDDLNWYNRKSRSSIEMQNQTFRPPIADNDANITEYDTIFLGFPIWWHIAPTIINTFLESYDFSNKTVIIFATSGSSGFNKTMEKLKPSASSSTNWIEGKVFRNHSDQSSLENWLNSLNVM